MARAPFIVGGITDPYIDRVLVMLEHLLEVSFEARYSSFKGDYYHYEGAPQMAIKRADLYENCPPFSEDLSEEEEQFYTCCPYILYLSFHLNGASHTQYCKVLSRLQQRLYFKCYRVLEPVLIEK